MVFLHSGPPICSLIFDISDPLTSPMKYFFLSLSIKKERTDGSIGYNIRKKNNMRLKIEKFSTS